jgi:hypothetical protein
MYTHNPPEQFSLVTRAESTCVERCEPTKFEHPLPLRLKHIQVRECLGPPRGCGVGHGRLGHHLMQERVDSHRGSVRPPFVDGRLADPAAFGTWW